MLAALAACDPRTSSDSLTTLANESPSITGQQMDKMVTNALSLTQLADYTQQVVCNSQVFSYHMMPFMTYVPSLQLHCSHSSEEQQHHQRLTNMLTACRMSRHIIAGDGNCCFASVCFSLSRNLLQLDDQHRLFLNEKGFRAGMSIGEMAATLRQLAVKEWMDNSHRYDQFLSDINIEEEAIKFLDSFHFRGDLGDTVLLCLANVLETPIIVLSSMAYHPIFCVTPEVQRIPLPLTVAYNQHGEGHFDGVVPVVPAASTATVVKTVSCVCGKNDKTDKKHCHEIKHKYTSLVNCACLKNEVGCSKKCTCRNCANILGTKSDAPVTKRHRSKHSWQQHQHSSSSVFANLKQEKLNSGPLTKHEYFLLESIISHCRQHEIEVNAVNVVNIYSTIISSTNKCDPSVQVSHKSTIEIEKYLKSRSNILKVFKELCAIQMTQSAEGPNNLSPTSVDDLSHNVAGDDSQLQEFNLTSNSSR